MNYEGQISDLLALDQEFESWVATLPPKAWAHHDLSAVRLGWNAHKRRALTNDFIRLSWQMLRIPGDEARSQAEGLPLRRLAAMVAWLYDPGKRESPEETRARFEDFLTNPDTKERTML